MRVFTKDEKVISGRGGRAWRPLAAAVAGAFRSGLPGYRIPGYRLAAAAGYRIRLLLGMKNY